MTATTPRRRPRQPTPGTDLGALDGMVNDLISKNKQLRREIAQLRRTAAPDAATVGESALRPLHRKLERAVSSVASTPSSRRRRAEVAARPSRTRRKLTDPVVLEKRRQALTKARQARSERLAAAKK